MRSKSAFTKEPIFARFGKLKVLKSCGFLSYGIL
jgi:hypothetical protein